MAGYGMAAHQIMVMNIDSLATTPNRVARSPAPIRSKPSAVPANDCRRPDNRNRAKNGGESVIKPNKQKTIGIVEVRSFRCPPAKHIDLLP